MAIDPKKVAAERAAGYVKNNMTVGLGTGSTVFHVIHKLGEMVKDGLTINTVSSSVQSEKIAKELKIPVIEFSAVSKIDIYIDGADEVDLHHNLIKGGGGALLREKILAYNSQRFIVIVDESKMVTALGAFPLPVEVVSFAHQLTLSHLRAHNAEVMIRQHAGKDFITDNGNLIADCRFGTIPDPGRLNQIIHEIPGVVESGIFTNDMVDEVIVGYKDGSVKVFPTS